MDDAALRHIHVCVFHMTQYAGVSRRLSKPFNPLLGETFELVTDKCRVLAEQVSHHPPVTAIYAHSTSGKYEVWTNTHSKTSFMGTSLEVTNHGMTHYRLTNQKELYTANRPSTIVHNILLGQMYVAQAGTVTCRQHTPGGEVNVLEFVFKKAGWGGAHHDEIEAEIPVRPGAAHKWLVTGTWNSKVEAFNEETGETRLIWQISPNPEKFEWQFFFNQFAIKLNDINDKYRKMLPTTDCRFRPDLRAYEEGKLELAGDEKHRLEEKQRAARARREREGTEYKPRYLFPTVDALTGDKVYRMERDYWRERALGDFGENQPDIF